MLFTKKAPPPTPLFESSGGNAPGMSPLSSIPACSDFKNHPMFTDVLRLNSDRDAVVWFFSKSSALFVTTLLYLRVTAVCSWFRSPTLFPVSKYFHFYNFFLIQWRDVVLVHFYCSCKIHKCLFSTFEMLRHRFSVKRDSRLLTDTILFCIISRCFDFCSISVTTKTFSQLNWNVDISAVSNLGCKVLKKVNWKTGWSFEYAIEMDLSVIKFSSENSPAERRKNTAFRAPREVSIALSRQTNSSICIYIPGFWARLLFQNYLTLTHTRTRRWKRLFF